MPFSGGTYSLPAGNPVVSGTTISSTVQNNTMTDIATALSTTLCKDGQSTPTGNLPMGGFKLTGLGAGAAAGDSLRWQQLFAQGTEVDIASASSMDIGGQNTSFLRVTGTTPVSSFGTNYNGPRFLRFAGAVTLTHNASTLILPGGASITTTAGDTCIAIPISGGWYVANYQFATNQAWQDLTASRATGTTYTNTTGRTILVAASVAGAVASSTVACGWTVGGVSGIDQSSLVTSATPSNTSLACTALVPAGATYSLVVTQATLTNWRELR